MGDRSIIGYNHPRLKNWLRSGDNYIEPFITIGHTSNIYFKNNFNIKYVVDTRKLVGFKRIDNNTLMVECGTPISRVSRFCVDNSIAGYEGMINLPGTVGGV